MQRLRQYPTYICPAHPLGAPHYGSISTGSISDMAAQRSGSLEGDLVGALGEMNYMQLYMANSYKPDREYFNMSGTADWKYLTRTIHGVSHGKGRLSDFPGIYVIFESEKKDKPVYVGRSGNSIFERLDDHYSEKGKKDNKELYDFILDQNILYYAVLKVENAKNRCGYERWLYDIYINKKYPLFNKERPRCNDVEECQSIEIKSPCFSYT